MNEVTIYDIARALELSPSTISRALSGGTLVRKDTLTKVLEKARDLGYRHNFFASNLRSNRTHFIGAIVPRLNTLFVSNILSGAEIMTSRLRYSLFVSQSMNNPELHMASIQTLNRNRVDGLLITSPYFQRQASLLHGKVRVDIPTIIIEGSSLANSQLKKTDRTNFEIAYEFTVHLAKKGCKRIALISSDADKTTHKEILGGYRHALDDVGMKNGDEIVLVQENSEKSRIALYRKLFSRTHRPDGVLVSNNIIAALAMPEFDTAATDCGSPPIIDEKVIFSSDDQLTVELGKIATCLLICLIENMHGD